MIGSNHCPKAPPGPLGRRPRAMIGCNENLVVCGPAGTGKSYFLEALGQLAVVLPITLIPQS